MLLLSLTCTCIFVRSTLFTPVKLLGQSLQKTNNLDKIWDKLIHAESAIRLQMPSETISPPAVTSTWWQKHYARVTQCWVGHVHLRNFTTNLWNDQTTKCYTIFEMADHNQNIKCPRNSQRTNFTVTKLSKVTILFKSPSTIRCV